MLGICVFPVKGMSRLEIRLHYLQGRGAPWRYLMVYEFFNDLLLIGYIILVWIHRSSRAHIIVMMVMMEIVDNLDL